MTEIKRTLTVLLAAAVVFMMFFSAVYIILEDGHDCAGEGCFICCQIAICENTLRSAGLTGSAVSFAVFIAVLMICVSFFTGKPAHNTSLVALKVKLSD